MNAPTSILPESVQADLLHDSIEARGEGVWFAWRSDDASFVIDIRNGVWWAENGRVLSLATGTGLHFHGGTDWEIYAFEGAAEGMCPDVCCHGDRAGAERCALIFLAEGRYCSDEATS